MMTNPYTFYGNAHTADFSVKATTRSIHRILTNHPFIQQSDGTYRMNLPRCTVTLHPKSHYIKVFANLQEILGTPFVSSSDAETILDIISDDLRLLDRFPRKIVLTRIDLKRDVVVPDEFERAIFLELFSKTQMTRQRLVKQEFLGSELQSVYYKSDAIFQSVRINVYDKTKERQNKARQPDHFESGVLRFEVQLMNRHLNYRKTRGEFEKNLRIYLRDESLEFFFQKYLAPIFFKGTYRSLTSATEMIEGATNISKRRKSSMIQFLNNCSEKNIDYAKNNSSTASWNESIRLLNLLDINPITIPCYYNKSELANPLSSVFKSR